MAIIGVEGLFKHPKCYEWVPVIVSYFDMVYIPDIYTTWTHPLVSLQGLQLSIVVMCPFDLARRIDELQLVRLLHRLHS